MKAFLFAILQVILASGLLYAYYHFFLRNSRFHQYNRFYLLMASVISLVIPFINIPVYFTTPENDTDAVWQVLRMMSTDTPVVVAATAEKNSLGITWQQGIYILYALVALVLIIRVIASLRAIHRLIRQHTTEDLGNIRFVNTSEPTAPFSFFRWLFWNKNIDISAPEGQQIFRHEVFHIHQKHSYDVLFLEVLTTIGWINPFYHLMKKELRTIHEFLADKFAARETDKWAYAELLLMQALHTRQRLVHPFFQSQIKRRIAMITSSTQPAYQYLRKVLVLPVAASVITLFAFSYKEIKNDQSSEPEILESLQVSTLDTVKPGEKLLFQADKIIFEASKEKQTTAANKAASLYIINDKRFTKAEFESTFGKNAIIEAKMVESYAANNTEAIQQYGENARNGVLVFKEASVTPSSPAIDASQKQNVVIRGNMFNSATPLFVIDGKVQEKDPGNSTLQKLNPNDIHSISVLKNKQAIDEYGPEASDGVVEITTKNFAKENGYTIDSSRYSRFMNVQKGEGAVFAEVEKPASFKGGITAWRKFLERNINSNVPIQNKAPYGTYNVDVQFIVDKEGNLRDLKALTKHGYGMEEEAVRMLTTSPAWEPAEQNGHKVAMYRVQPVTFVVLDENGKGGELKEVTVTGYAKPKSGEIKEVVVEGYPVKEVTVTGYAKPKSASSEKVSGEIKEVVVEGFPTAGRNSKLDEVVVVGYGTKKNTEPVKIPDNLVTIYPNPTGNAATISLQTKKAGTGHIRIADMGGNILSVQKVGLSAGTNSYTINTTGLNKGSYLVSVTSDNDKTPIKALKLIKN